MILKKLEYFKSGGSAKHLQGVRAMLRVSGDEIDMAYLQRWLRDLDLEGEWKRVKED